MSKTTHPTTVILTVHDSYFVSSSACATISITVPGTVPSTVYISLLVLTPLSHCSDFVAICRKWQQENADLEMPDENDNLTEKERLEKAK